MTNIGIGGKVAIHVEGCGGRTVCIEGWQRDGYFCITVSQEDLALSDFEKVLGAEFPDRERVEITGDGNSWIANGKTGKAQETDCPFAALDRLRASNSAGAAL